MAQVLVTEDYLEDIADAIRGKNGLLAQYKPGQMAAAIEAIPTGSAVLTTKTITANGTYDAEDDNADGYSEVTVNVSGQSTPGVVAAELTHNGYLDANGTFYYGPGATFALYVFQATANHTYCFIKNTGNRFRIARFDTDIRQATGNVSGTTMYVNDTSDPVTDSEEITGSYYIVFMVSNQNGSTPALIVDINAIQ